MCLTKKSVLNSLEEKILSMSAKKNQNTQALESLKIQTLFCLYVIIVSVVWNTSYHACAFVILVLTNVVNVTFIL